jgi:hypothetical protein
VVERCLYWNIPNAARATCPHTCRHSSIYTNGGVNEALSGSVRRILFWLGFHNGSIPELAKKIMSTGNLGEGT